MQTAFPNPLPERRPPIPLNLAFPGQRFRVIVPDPPWRYANWTKAKNGAAVAHYDCMGPDELNALPLPAVAAKDSMCLLWTTGPKMNEATQLLEAWGFEYITVAFVWEKLNKDGTPVYGPGWHSASSCEYVLLGKRGKGRARIRERQLVVTTRKPEVLAAVRPPRSHSRKPDEVYERIQRMYPGPYLELFARRPRKGWVVWGDEVGPWPPKERKDGNHD